jgi:signal transduction histidine kinase/GNAT superfamily N-acetyltransferase
MFMAYTIQGQWFRPMYFVAFMQLSTAYAFLFSVPKRIFRVILPLWSVLFLSAAFLKWDDFLQQRRNLAFSDFILYVIITAGIGWVIHAFFIADRVFREQALAKFGRIGLQSARLVHDLKGLTGAPKLYAGILQEKLKGMSDPTISEALVALSQDVNTISEILVEMNQMASLKGTELSSFSFEEAWSTVRLILNSRLRDIRVSYPIQLEMHSDKSVLRSVLLNLMLNSLDSFRRNRTESPEIRIEREGSSLIFSDNSGGFSAEVLKSFSKVGSAAGEAHGSGLGLWLIAEAMQALGGKLFLKNVTENGQNWSRVELLFRKGALARRQDQLEMALHPLQAQDVVPLRAKILRPNRPVEEAVFTGDRDPQVGHYGVVEQPTQAIRGVVTIYPEGLPSSSELQTVTDEISARVKERWGREPSATEMWRLRGMAVDDGFRGHGLGGPILQACVAHARERGGRLIWAHARTRALQFYRRHGFQTVGSEYDLPGVGPHYLICLIL